MTFGVGPSLFGQIWLGTLQLAILESNTQYKRNRGGSEKRDKHGLQLIQTYSAVSMYSSIEGGGW